MLAFSNSTIELPPIAILPKSIIPLTSSQYSCIDIPIPGLAQNHLNHELQESSDVYEKHSIRAKPQDLLLTSTLLQSSPRPSSPINSPPSAGTSTARPSSPPGGAKTAIRRKAAADRADKVANARPTSTRAAGAGGSSSTMLSKNILSSMTLAGKDCWDL
ncbi:MAG: hypothetical protein Q9193_005953, partial [Seirophora villosa]